MLLRKNEFRCFVCTWRVVLVERFSRLLALGSSIFENQGPMCVHRR